MWMWLASTGNKFAVALPGSTNYLSAYDAHGRLKRSTEGESRQRDEFTGDGEQAVLPPERASDLIPFPLNRSFRSQNVTSEALR